MTGSDRLPRALLALAALAGACGVALGAVAAHAVADPRLTIASSFLLFHAPAILALGALRTGGRLILAAQACLLVGVVLFSATLALDVLLGIRMSPSPAPLGGTLMIVGWLIAAAGLLSGRVPP